MKDAAREWTEGGGAQALGGLPFVLVGLGLAGAGLFAALRLGRPIGDVLPFVAFGSTFALVGVPLLLGRSGVVLDGSRRTVTTWWGLLSLPLRRRVSSVPLDGLVTIERVTRRRGKNSTITVYPVRVGPKVGETALLGELAEHALARRIAERAGKAFGVDVEDRTLDPPSVRRGDQLDLSVRRRLRDAPPPAPSPPPAPRCTVARGERGRVAIEVPGTLALEELFLGVLGLAAGLFILPPFLFVALGAGLPVAWIAGLLGVAGLGALVLVRRISRAVARSRRPTRIALDRDALTVAWKETSVELPLDELEEVALVKAGLQAFAPAGPDPGPEATSLLGGLERERLLFLSDAQTVAVGLPLGRVEAEWLRDVIVHAVATGGAPPAASQAG